MLSNLLGGRQLRVGSESDRLNVFSVIDLETLVLYPLYCWHKRCFHGVIPPALAVPMGDCKLWSYRSVRSGGGRRPYAVRPCPAKLDSFTSAVYSPPSRSYWKIGRIFLRIAATMPGGMTTPTFFVEQDIVQSCGVVFRSCCL